MNFLLFSSYISCKFCDEIGFQRNGICQDFTVSRSGVGSSNCTYESVGICDSVSCEPTLRAFFDRDLELWEDSDWHSEFCDSFVNSSSGSAIRNAP